MHFWNHKIVLKFLSRFFFNRIASILQFSSFWFQDEVTAQVNLLLELKKQYKALTGKDFAPPSAPTTQQQPKKSEPVAKGEKGKKDSVGKKAVEESGKKNNKNTPAQESSKESEGSSREIKKVTRWNIFL